MEKSSASLKDLKELMRSLSEIVDLQVRHIEQGFNSQEIASTFADLYLRQLEKVITPEIAVKVQQSSCQQSSPTDSDAAISYCLTLCCELMKAVASRLKKS